MDFPEQVAAMIAGWQAIEPPNKAAQVMAADLVGTIRAVEAVRDGMRFEDEPSSFEAALRDLAE